MVDTDLDTGVQGRFRGLSKSRIFSDRHRGQALIITRRVGSGLLQMIPFITKGKSLRTFRTLELAIEFYGMSEKSDIKGNLRDQLLRAASSISLNLSEGNAKYTVRDKRRFFQMAYGSLRECQTIFKLTKTDNKELIQKADHLGASLYKLLKSEIKEFR